MKAPKEIYLQFYPDSDDDLVQAEFIGDTWCQHRINESDQKYIRADLVIMRRDIIKQAIGPEHRDEKV